MRFQGLDRLVAIGLLEPKPPDPDRVRRWLARSQRDRDLARDLLANVDPERAMGVAYEAGYRACAGFLVLAGYRVTSQPGHHRAAIEGAAAVLGPWSQALMRRLDAARRFRNESLYGDAPPVPERELDGLIADVTELLERLDEELRKAGS